MSPKPELDVKLLEELAQNTSVGRRILAKHSFRYRCKYYHERELWPHQERWALRLKRTKMGGIIAPPGHGKTEVISRYLPEDLISQNRNVRILMISQTESLAIKNGSLIRSDLESNAKLITDYGPFRSRRNIWTDKRFTVIRSKNLKDATFEAVGMGGAITGGRYDYIILDDVIDEYVVRNPEIRQFYLDYLFGTIIPRLEPWGCLWFIGTRKHRFDLYDSLIKHPQFRVIVELALMREPDPKTYDLVELEEPELDDHGQEILWRVDFHTDDHGEALCPAIWPVDKLLLRRKSNSRAFSREYQGQVTDDDSVLIKWEWLQWCLDRSRSWGTIDRNKYIGIITGVDPALVTDKKTAEGHDTDWAVFLTGGICSNHKLELIGLKRDRGLSPNALEQAYIGQADYFEPDLMFNEVNSFGTIYQWQIRHKTNIPIVAHRTTGRNKYDAWEGVPSLAAIFENKQISIPYATPEDQKITDCFIQELYEIEEGPGKDDQRMALWILYSGVRRYLKQLDYLKKTGRK